MYEWGPDSRLVKWFFTCLEYYLSWQKIFICLLMQLTDQMRELSLKQILQYNSSSGISAISIGSAVPSFFFLRFFTSPPASSRTLHKRVDIENTYETSLKPFNQIPARTYIIACYLHEREKYISTGSAPILTEFTLT